MSQSIGYSRYHPNFHVTVSTLSEEERLSQTISKDSNVIFYDIFSQMYDVLHDSDSYDDSLIEFCLCNFGNTDKQIASKNFINWYYERFSELLTFA